MQPAPNATVFIVDDDASVREALAWLLRSRHLLSESYAGAEEFEAMLGDRFMPFGNDAGSTPGREAEFLSRHHAFILADGQSLHIGLQL